MRESEGSASFVSRLLPPVELLGADGQPKPTRMTPTEQLVAAGLGVANIAIAAATASSVKSQQALVLAAGLAASVITVLGARVGNRIVTIVGLFASALSVNSGAGFFPLIVPYYGAATWIFLKYNKLVKSQAILRRQQRAVAGPRSAGPAARGKAPATKATPTKSKRYTPPKVRKKRPAPPTKPPRDRSIVD